MTDLSWLKTLLAEASPGASPDNATDWWFTVSNHPGDHFNGWHVCRQLEGRTSEQFGPMPLVLAEEIKDRLNAYHEGARVLGPLTRCALALEQCQSDAEDYQYGPGEDARTALQVIADQAKAALAALAESAGQCAETEGE